MTIADSRVVAEACRECGMPCTPTEYHPYSACLMFRGCHNSKVVRENLRPLSLLAEAERERDQALREADNLHRGCVDLVEQNLALHSRLDAVVGLADEWCAGDGYETGIPHIDEATSNRLSAKRECADAVRNAVNAVNGGE